MRTFFFLSLMLFAIISMGQSTGEKIDTKIEQVTVFFSGAQVKRTGSIVLQKGKTELVFGGISPKIDKQSIQIKGEGDFTILSVVHQINVLKEQDPREEIEVLERQKNLLRQKMTVERHKLSVYKNEETLLSKNQSIGGSNTGVKTADLKEAADFHRARLTEIFNVQIEIERNIAKIDSTIKKIDTQLHALNQPKNTATSEVVVAITAEKAGNARFELTYFVQDASWFPTYDLRVQEVTKPIALTMKANIAQQSGEDWKSVRFFLSNGNPKDNGVAPTLAPWFLNFEQYGVNIKGSRAQGSVFYIDGVQIPGTTPRQVSGVVRDEKGEPLIGATVKIKGSSIGTVTNLDGAFALQIPSGYSNIVEISYTGYKKMETHLPLGRALDIHLSASEANEEVAITAYKLTSETIKNLPTRNVQGIAATTADAAIPVTEKYQPTTLVFEINVPYTVLNDGKVYTAEIGNQEVPAEYQYFAVPKLDKAAYLTARITDWQDRNLLDGEANLYFEGAYLGKSVLDLTQAGDTLQVSLGKDPGVMVDRKKQKEYTRRQFLSNNKSDSRAFEITVRNNKPSPVRITVLDQFPISTNKDISVEHDENSGALHNKETGELNWTFDLPSKVDKKLIFKYTVKYPRNQVLGLE